LAASHPRGIPPNTEDAHVGENRMGNGLWLRGQTEHCILAVRGKPLVTLTLLAEILLTTGEI
jgi:N6-adenosine-specific RNA methylase IME4